MERLDNGMENVQLYGSNEFCFKAILIMVIITIVSNTYSSIENHGSVKKRLPKWCHDKHEIYHFE